MTLDTTVGGASSDSYATLAEYQAKAAAFGWTLGSTDVADEVNLRKAAQFLDSRHVYRGTKATAEQAREWPRYDSLESTFGYAYYPYPIFADKIPLAIKEAQMEMAFLIQGGATPFATVDGLVKRKREKLDVIEEETEYFGGQGRQSYPGVTAILRHYIIGGPGQSQMVRG
jgi:hypothetical protein